MFIQVQIKHNNGTVYLRHEAIVAMWQVGGITKVQLYGDEEVMDIKQSPEDIIRLIDVALSDY